MHGYQDRGFSDNEEGLPLHPIFLEAMLDELAPAYTVALGSKLIGLHIDIEERRKNIVDRRVYMTRYGRVSLTEIKGMTVTEIHRQLNSIAEIIGKENTVSSLNERS